MKKPKPNPARKAIPTVTTLAVISLLHASCPEKHPSIVKATGRSDKRFLARGAMLPVRVAGRTVRSRPPKYGRSQGGVAASDPQLVAHLRGRIALGRRHEERFDLSTRHLYSLPGIRFCEPPACCARHGRSPAGIWLKPSAVFGRVYWHFRHEPRVMGWVVNTGVGRESHAGVGGWYRHRPESAVS
jgi:hypothetical protein